MLYIKKFKSYSHQFHEYQQNGKLNPFLTKHKNKTTTYDVENPGYDLRHSPKCRGLLMGSQHCPVDNWIVNDNTYINKR